MNGARVGRYELISEIGRGGLGVVFRARGQDGREVARTARARSSGIADYTRALELDPLLASAWSNRALLRSRIGDRRGARADYERYLELAPDEPDARAARRWLAENP